MQEGPRGVSGPRAGRPAALLSNPAQTSKPTNTPHPPGSASSASTHASDTRTPWEVVAAAPPPPPPPSRRAAAPQDTEAPDSVGSGWDTGPGPPPPPPPGEAKEGPEGPGPGRPAGVLPLGRVLPPPPPVGPPAAVAGAAPPEERPGEGSGIPAAPTPAPAPPAALLLAQGCAPPPLALALLPPALMLTLLPPPLG